MTSITVTVPLTIRRRGGRKQIIGPDGVAIHNGGDAMMTGGDPVMVKALARAFRWRRLLETGQVCSFSDIARQEKLSRSYVSRLLRLTELAPDIVEAILDGRRPPQTTLALLLNPFPIVWEDQRAGLLGQSSVPLARRLR